MSLFECRCGHLYYLLEQSKFIPNTNRIAQLQDKKKKQSYSCPVGLKWNYLCRDYQLPKFDEVNGGDVYDYVCKIIDDYCKENKIDFKFNALTINKNFICKPHFDSGNLGETLIFGVGDYKDGRLIKNINPTEAEYVDIHNKPHIFNATEIEHYNEDHSLTRYTIVCYWI